MANQPKTNETPITTVRIPRDLKLAVKSKAKDEGVTLTSVIVAALREYLLRQP